MKTLRTTPSATATAVFLAIFLVAAASITPETQAAEAEVPAAASTQVAQTTNLDQVVVTGSRFKRSAGDSTAPIDVISGAELQQLGASDITSALNEVLPSFNLPAISGQDQSAIVRPANLRGLNGDQTLVLVNGKRRHVSAVVNANSSINKGSEPADLNLIPFSMVDRVEVLRDGAAAQYGSDAIAGVINIVLKKATPVATLTSKAGEYGFKDGNMWQETLDKGWLFGQGGYVNGSVEYLDQRHTDRSFATLPQNDTGPGGAPAFYWGQGYNGTANPTAFDPREASATGKHDVQDGIPDQHGINVGYNAGLPLALGIPGGAQLYSFSTFSHRTGTGYENFRYANGSRDPTFCPNGVGGTPDNPYCQIYPNGFEPHEVITENDFGATLGLKGQDFFGWGWDLSSTYGKDDARVGVENTLNATLGPSSPTKFYNGSWISTELTNNLDLTHAFEIGLPNPLDVAVGFEHRNDSYTVKPGEAGSYDFGPNDICRTNPNAQYCTFTAPDGSIQQPNAGAQSYNGFTPGQSGHDYRDSFAGYFDLEAKPLKGLDVGLAGRFEHYDDFGNTRTGKISTRYQVVPALAVRGTLSNGFRAPSVGQSIYGSSSTFFSGGQAFDILTAPVGSDTAVALGSSPLKPEKSTNQSLGAILTPIKNLDVTLDLYRIYIRDRISESGYIGPDYQSGASASGAATTCNNGTALAAGQPVIDCLFPVGTNPLDLQYFGNLVNTRNQGADLVLNYRSDFHRYGVVRWTAAANWNQTKITGITAAPAVFSRTIDAAGDSVQSANPGFNTVFDPTQQGFLTVATPRNKAILGATYTEGPFTSRLTVTRYGKVVDTTNTPPNGPPEAYFTITPKAIVDLDLSYKLTHWLTLGAGADNLLNTYPPQTNAAYQSNQGPFGFGKYSGFSPYGYFGGFYYGRAVIRF